jgi:hypothetical protein
MSSTLKIEPDERSARCLSDELKFILRKKNKCGTVHFRVDEKDIPYLQALVDMEIKDADVVIDYIEKHGSCVIWEQF